MTQQFRGNVTRSILLASILAVGRFAIGFEPTAADQAEKFQFAPGNVVIIPTEVFGESHPMVLATSIEKSIFSNSFQEKFRQLEKPEGLVIPPKQAEAEFYPPVDMKIGKDFPWSFRSSTAVVVCSDKVQSAISELGGGGTGFLSMDYVHSKVLRLNSSEGYAQLVNVAVAESEYTERLTMREKVPHLSVHLSTGFESCKIATSSYNHISINTELFNKLLTKRRMVLTLPVSDIRDGTTFRIGILDWLEIGPYRFHNVVVHEDTASEIGMALLAKFDVEFDFPNRLAYFKRGKLFDTPSPRLRSGFSVRRLQGKTLAYGVNPQGIGAKAQIRDNDQVLVVNGRETSQSSIFKIRDLLTEPGAELKLVLERDGVRRDVTLQLTNDPDPFPVVPEQVVERPIPDFE